MRARRLFKSIGIMLLAVLLVAGAAVARLYYLSLEPGHDLNVKVEGAVVDWNVRDAAASFNDCLGRPLMKPGRVFRAAVWFSGWSCVGVGDPDVVYTFNYKPQDGREYYCRSPQGNRIGRHFNTRVELNDLEFRRTWDDPEQRRDACGFFADSYAAIARGEKVLIHCDAGRDRTGTYAALLQALVAEAKAPLDAAVVAAVECDYRKSRSLVPVKFGRMERFLADIEARDGSVRNFLISQCQIAPAALDATVLALSWPSGQSLVK